MILFLSSYTISINYLVRGEQSDNKNIKLQEKVIMEIAKNLYYTLSSKS
jgi:hypothetical protein